MSLPHECAPWTSAEDARLRAVYPVSGIEGAKAVLPARSESALFHRARRLGLSRRRRWTSGDVAILRDGWASGRRVSLIAKDLRRTVATVYVMARKLGLRAGCPEGFEYLSRAADRTGFCPSQLWRILRFTGTPVLLALARPTKGATYRRHIVEPEAVDEAIAAWMRTEPVEAIARRLGMCGETLRDRLKRLGVENPPGGKAHLRVDAEAVRRALALPPGKRRPVIQHPRFFEGSGT